MSRPVYEELLSRLDHFALNPAVVLDIDGQRAGLPEALRARFARARIISTGQAKKSAGMFASMFERIVRRGSRIEYIDATRTRWSLDDQSVDLVVANDWAPGIEALDASLSEIHRVLLDGGLFLCSSPSATAVRGQADIHDLGSALMRAGFVEPVLDIDRFESGDREIIYVAAFSGGGRRWTSDGEVVVPFPKSSRR